MNYFGMQCQIFNLHQKAFKKTMLEKYEYLLLEWV